MAEEKKLTGDPRKDHGWHSRQHQGRSEQDVARQLYQSEHGQAARKTSAAERLATMAVRTPESRLAELDRRLGVGIGAVRERQRLAAIVNK